MECILNIASTECWALCRAAGSSDTAWVGNAYMRSRLLLGQSSRYLAKMTRPILTKHFKAWAIIFMLVPVCDILIPSQFRHSAAPNWHVLNYWLAYTMTDLIADGFVTVGPITVKFGWDWENVSSLKFRKFHLNPSNFNGKLTMMLKLDLKKYTCCI